MILQDVDTALSVAFVVKLDDENLGDVHQLRRARLRGGHRDA